MEPTPSWDEPSVLKVNSDLFDSAVVVGKVTPSDALLSVSYIGECGRSYYRDVEVVESVFTLNIPFTFVHEIELLLSTSKGVNVSKTLHIIDSGHLQTKKGDECDYMRVSRGNEDHSTLFVVEESCYTIGYKYGSCVSRSHLNIPCKVGTNVSIPFRCRDTIETKKGIEAGRI